MAKLIIHFIEGSRIIVDVPMVLLPPAEERLLSSPFLVWKRIDAEFVDTIRIKSRAEKALEVVERLEARLEAEVRFLCSILREPLCSVQDTLDIAAKVVWATEEFNARHTYSELGSDSLESSLSFSQ